MCAYVNSIGPFRTCVCACVHVHMCMCVALHVVCARVHVHMYMYVASFNYQKIVATLADILKSCATHLCLCCIKAARYNMYT